MGSRLEKKSNAVRKRIESHTFDDEEGEEYNASAFGGFPDYFRRKKIKLQNLDSELRSQAADNPQIFRGIVAHVNGYTQPSLNDLHKLIVQHGGGFLQYLDGKTMVTHIIASNLTPKKAVEFKRYRIVKPAWVVESVKAGKLLPWNDFRLLSEGAGQRVLGFDNGQVVSQADTKRRGYRDQSDTSWYAEKLKANINTPESCHKPGFQAQKAIPKTVEEIHVSPPGSYKPDSGSGSFLHDEHVNPATSPPPNSTPQLLRDLRDLQAFEDFQESIQYDDFGQDEEATAEPYKGIEPSATSIKAPEDLVAAPRERIETKGGELPTAADYEPLPQMKRAVDVLPETPSKRAKMTAEEHNAELLADPRIRKSTVVNPEFLEQYYRESRLHHLSAWKAELKSQMQAMAEAKTPSQKAREKRLSGVRRYVLHVDFDSFFAAVSLKKHPELKDKPVAIAHGGGTGSEIASCNYPARKFGISNGMWMSKAQNLCPQLKVLPYDFPAYEEASRNFYEAIIATGGIVQSVSIDEALVDVSHLCYAVSGTDGVKRNEGGVFREQAKADEIAQALRDQVRKKTGCEVSIGIGGNILLAKVALRKAKPAGQFHLRPEEVLDFIGELKVQDLPGVAWSIGGKLEEIGIKFVKDIRDYPRDRLINALGPKTGQKLWDYSRGIDRKDVGDVEIRKSVSAEVNWGVRFVTQEQVDEFIENLCGELQRRLLKERVKGRHLSLKIMRKAADAPLDPPKHLGHGKCDTYNKSVSLGVSTNSKDVLTKETLSLLKGFNFTPGELRGIGVQMQKLEPLKSFADGYPDSSQRKLQFKLDGGKHPGPPTKARETPQEDPIEDMVTPTKQRAPDRITFGADQLNQSTPSRKPLNTLGTQFVMPTQVDSEVLAELPAEIREKLVKHIRAGKATAVSHGLAASAAQLSAIASMTALPNQSQLDPDILHALPEDVRAEILAFYQMASSKRKVGEQSVLPQSPHKNRTLAAAKRPLPAPTRRRGRGGGLFGPRNPPGNSTLTQANFIAHKAAQQRGHTPVTDTDTDEAGYTSAAEPLAAEIDAGFLEALPEDIRREVLAEQRRLRMQAKSGLNLAAPPRKDPLPPAKSKDIPVAPAIQRLLRLPPWPPKPTFTTKKLSSLPDLREAMADWVREFGDDAPYPEDTEALGKYLAKVVQEEGDMAKAVAVVQWLAWLVNEEVLSTPAKGKWQRVVETVQDVVQSAVRQRGLGRVQF